MNIERLFGSSQVLKSRLALGTLRAPHKIEVFKSLLVQVLRLLPCLFLLAVLSAAALLSLRLEGPKVDTRIQRAQAVLVYTPTVDIYGPPGRVGLYTHGRLALGTLRGCLSRYSRRSRRRQLTRPHPASASTQSPGIYKKRCAFQ